MILVDEVSLGKIRRNEPLRWHDIVLVTSFFYPESVYGDEDGEIYRNYRKRRILRGESLDTPIEDLVRNALSKAWGCKYGLSDIRRTWKWEKTRTVMPQSSASMMTARQSSHSGMDRPSDLSSFEIL